jgi:hypothetical protein
MFVFSGGRSRRLAVPPSTRDQAVTATRSSTNRAAAGPLPREVDQRRCRRPVEQLERQRGQGGEQQHLQGVGPPDGRRVDGAALGANEQREPWRLAIKTERFNDKDV